VNNLKVAVVHHEDLGFNDEVGSFLFDQFHIYPTCYDYLSSGQIKRDKPDILLVNSDPLEADKNLANKFRAAAISLVKNKKVIFMLTRNLSARNALRDQEMAAADTVDIAGGMGGLKLALARHLLVKQLDMFKKR